MPPTATRGPRITGIQRVQIDNRNYLGELQALKLLQIPKVTANPFYFLRFGALLAQRMYLLYGLMIGNYPSISCAHWFVVTIWLAYTGALSHYLP